MKHVLLKNWKLLVAFIFAISLAVVLFVSTKTVFASADTSVIDLVEDTEELTDEIDEEDEEEIAVDLSEIESSIDLNEGEESFDKVPLSQLSENEIFEFLANNNVSIPKELENTADLGEFIRSTIIAVENNPECEFCYNYYVTLNFVEEIKTAVNNYYGIDSGYSTYSATTYASSYTLQDSILWSNTNVGYYNCYAYAIGRNENPPQYSTSKQYQPGDFSKQSFILNPEYIANVVKADLKVLGFCDIVISKTPPTVSAGMRLICVRTGRGDYHFMKYDGGSWYHKPGFTAILRYNYSTASFKVWENEYVDAQGVAHSGSYTYDSDVYYISYTDPSRLFGGGTGTNADPYLISNTTHFENISKTADFNLNYQLTKDIYYTSNPQIAPIEQFNGVLDGNGYSLTQFQLNSSYGNNIGLCAINSGTIKNLTLGVCFYIYEDHSNVNVGAFAGINKGIISNCSITAVYNRPFFRCYAKGDSYMGCFAGINEGTIVECKGGDRLTGSCNMGIIAGKNTGWITNCTTYNLDDIFFDYNDYNACLGGIVGVQESGGVGNCKFQGKIIFQNYQSSNYNSQKEDRALQPCAGIIIGHKIGGTVSGNTWASNECVLSNRNFYTVTWTTGALWWKETHTHNQGLYFRNAECGR